MGQEMLQGPGAASKLECLVPGDIPGLRPGRQRYTLLTNTAGGIIDDLMVAARGEDRFFLVGNANRRAADAAHVAAALPLDMTLSILDDRALLAKA